MNLPAPDGLGGDRPIVRSRRVPGCRLICWGPATSAGLRRICSGRFRPTGCQSFSGLRFALEPGFRWRGGDDHSGRHTAGTAMAGYAGGAQADAPGPPIKRLRKLSQEWQKLAGTFDPAKMTLPVTTPADMLGGYDNWPPIFLEDEKNPETLGSQWFQHRPCAGIPGRRSY